MAHAQQIGLALEEEGWLTAFVTTFAWNQAGPAASLLSKLPDQPFGSIARQLKRRSITSIPYNLVRTTPSWELLRTFCQKVLKSDTVADMVWDKMSIGFDKSVARNYVPDVHAVHAFEYTALASFERAKELGVARVLHVPSLDNLQFREIQARERIRWPALCKQNDKYFESKFERRHARRRAEIELADIIVTNSSLTARSHVAAGADPRKVVTVLLGAPPPIDEATIRPRSTNAPLRVVWAGPFSLRKGAHYLLEAWRKLQAGSTAELHVFGQIAVPKSMSALDQLGLRFHGSVQQSKLFAAFLDADVLVFPTLSDGFGMVVAEAFAHGLPVITTDAAGASELVNPKNGLLTPPGDPEALTDALRWCLDNRHELQEMRLAALQTARDRQWSHFRGDLMNALREARR